MIVLRGKEGGRDGERGGGGGGGAAGGVSLFNYQPHLPNPHLTGLTPTGLVEPARQPAGCLFPASLTDRIFIACMEHSSSQTASLSRY